MFSNAYSKKKFVFTLTVLGFSVYLFSIIAIAQTANQSEKVVLTLDAMSEIIGGKCGTCTNNDCRQVEGCDSSCVVIPPKKPGAPTPTASCNLDFGYQDCPHDTCNTVLSLRNACDITDSTNKYTRYEWNCFCYGDCLIDYGSQTHSGIRKKECSNRTSFGCL